MAFLELIALAFFGGFILNLMPCVLPVLTMKVFQSIEHQGEDIKKSRMHAIAYTMGTLALFTSFAALIIILRSFGKQLGWGMHFQQPYFVASLIIIVFALALNSLGVYELTLSMNNKEKDGFLGSFFTGIFAALMATPCSAPLLGTATGFALNQDTPEYQTMLLFIFIGLGLAFPFLALGFFPKWGRFLPKPGQWMVTFKHITGFTLIGAALWLLGDTLINQISTESIKNFLYFLGMIAFSLYIIGNFAALHHSQIQRWSMRLFSLLIILVSGFFWFDLQPKEKNNQQNASNEIVIDNHINWVDFNEERITSTAKKNQLIFMDFTADWCANCKTNDKLFIETQMVRESLQKNNILPMQVDMTSEDERMNFWLNKIGRSAIPAYVIVFPNGDMDVLPVAITSQLLKTHFEAANKALASKSFDKKSAK